MKLRQEFDKVVEMYVAALLKMYGWSGYYGYWVGDDTTGIYAYGDSHFIALHDLIYIVDNKVPEKTLEEWEEYCLWAHNFKQTIPNLDAWVKGCPRASKEEMTHLENLKMNLDKEIENYQEKF